MSESRHLAVKEINKLRAHYLDPARRAGFKYTDVEIYLDFVSIDIKGTQATVKLFEEGRLTYTWPSGEVSVNKYYNIEHDVSVTRQNDKWLITSDAYTDLFTVPDRSPKKRPAEKVGPEPGANKEPGDVSILGYYVPYNRAGAVTYAGN